MLPNSIPSRGAEATILCTEMRAAQGFPRWLSGKQPAYQCRRRWRRRFYPWVGKIPGEANGNRFTPVFLPGESHGQRILAGCNPWGNRESDTTEHTRARGAQTTRPGSPPACSSIFKTAQRPGASCFCYRSCCQSVCSTF